MNYTILLDRSEDIKKIEAQEQARFIKNIFEIVQIPIEFEPDKEFTVEEKIQFKKSLSEFNINIIDDMDSGLKIYVDRDLIAEWMKPKFKLKGDNTNIDPNKRLYIEMEISFTSIFEEDNE